VTSTLAVWTTRCLIRVRLTIAATGSQFFLVTLPDRLLQEVDCGTVVCKSDPLELQKTAKRWMSDEAKKRALRLE